VVVGLADSTVSLVVGLISGVIALASLGWQARTQRRQREEDRAAEAERLVRRYTEPLVYASDQLLNRIHNIDVHGFLHKFGGTRHDYVVESTAFSIAELLGWMELLRQDQQLVGLGEEESTRSLNECLQRVGRAFASSHIVTADGLPAPFMIWRHDQRAIGELMIARADGTPRCLGYARFTTRLRDDDGFRPWFARLVADIEAGIVDDAAARVRLAQVREATQGLLDHLDPRKVRIPR
jgi:hypothetical protein